MPGKCKGSSFITQTRAAINVAIRLMVDDPVHLFVQATRRLPANLRRRLSRINPPRWVGPTGRALLYTVADRREQAQQVLPTCPNTALANALRVVQGVELPPGAPNRVWARQLWDVGEISQALAVAPLGSVFHRHVQAQQRILAPGSRLKPPRVMPGKPARHDGGLRVIHQLTNSLPWTQSGYALRSHHVLQSLRSNGVEVKAITRVGYPLVVGKVTKGGYDVVDGVEYERILPVSTPRDVGARLHLQARFLVQAAQRFGAQIIHTTTPYDNALVAEAAARALGVPWVYEARGEMENTWLASRPGWAYERALNSDRYRLMRAKEAEVAARADAVVTLSQVQRHSLIERGVPPQKITVIGNAVDERLLHMPVDQHSARTRLGLGQGPWVGTVSAVVDYEGLDTLIEAVGVMHQRGVPVKAAIVGDGVALADLRDHVRRRGLGDHVVFPGRVPPQEALTWYQALDVMVIPRKDTLVTRTVTPIKGLQAMALGIPQVVSDLPALVEIGSQNGQGITVQPEDPVSLADGITELLANPKRLSEVSQKARNVAAGYTWGHRAGQYRGLYEELLQPES